MARGAAAETHKVPAIVLLVDDDPDTRQMYATFLESSGMWVATAASPGEALAAMQDVKPDVVVTDMGFPGFSDGVDFIRALKEQSSTHKTPSIVLSGRGRDEIPASTSREADLHLLKPVLPDLLLERVRELLEQCRGLPSDNDSRPGVTEVSQPRATDLHQEPAARRCPGCAATLEWVERGTIAGTEYDYYRWCVNGCGLYCYDCRASKWLNLA